jgi:hypothetical protein
MNHPPAVFCLAGGLIFTFLRRKDLYNPSMNKRAKKRLKETIEKENQERAKIRKEQGLSSSKESQERRGFLPKPEKKRG